MARVRKPSAAVPHLSMSERVARGRAARKEVPRSTHAVFELAAGRADPVELLERQAQTRVPELVLIRYGRMLVSPSLWSTAREAMTRMAYGVVRRSAPMAIGA